MLLTESYREQNAQLHSHGGYGCSGHKHAERVAHLCKSLGSFDVLDYGCGQQTLAKSLSFPIRSYDPCIPGLDVSPDPADVVFCGDVLEHVEPECLDDVLDDLKRVTKVVGLFYIPTRPSKKILPDGRNAHLIQQPAEWWFPKLFKRFGMVQITDNLIRPEKSLGFFAMVTPRAS